jgi:tRNA(Ile)-lysidine synthase
VEPLEEKVAAFIQAHAMFGKASAVLLAVSGGADSTALLHITHELMQQGLLSANLFCLHIDHQLRGDASRTDAAFVAEQAKQLDLPCDTRSVDVGTYAHDHHISVETAGREIRLSTFAEVARSRGCNWVATGHQKNDNAETILQRLRRGTGYRGLRGMQPTRLLQEGIMLARPLLSNTREEIVNYLRRRGLTWREDRSNIDCGYTRNLIRHRLLPALQLQAQGSLVDELAELANRSARLYEEIRCRAEEAARKYVSFPGDHVAVDAEALAALAQPVAAELIRMQLVQLGCGERDLTARHYASVLQLAWSQVDRGRVTLPSGFVARRDGTALLLSGARPRPRPPASASVVLPVPGDISFAGCAVRADITGRAKGQPVQIPTDKTEFVEYFDLDRIEQPLVVRCRRPGDSFWPLGLRGPKKVGKFLTTAKVSTERRERIILFADGWRVVWVCPVRISERVKVTEQTQRVLKLSVDWR